MTDYCVITYDLFFIYSKYPTMYFFHPKILKKNTICENLGKNSWGQFVNI